MCFISIIKIHVTTVLLLYLAINYAITYQMKTEATFIMDRPRAFLVKFIYFAMFGITSV